jgi:predicted aspartyl protease
VPSRKALSRIMGAGLRDLAGRAGSGYVTPPMQRSRSRSALLAVALSVLAGCTAPTRDCSLRRVARLDIQMADGLPITQAILDGHPVRLVVDTGAERSILTEAAAQRLHLPQDLGHITQTTGIGGPSTNWDLRVDSLVLGGVRFPVGRMAVGRLDIGEHHTAAPVGLLGADILLAFDLDLDLAHNEITLYAARRCEDARPPWDEPALAIPGVETSKDRVLVPLRLDGERALAVFDTGAQHTTIGADLAARLGVNEEAGTHDPMVMQHGAGPDSVPAYLHRFDRLSIGPAIIRDPQLAVVGGDFGLAYSLIGQDFMKGRRIWISFAGAKVFVTPLPDDASQAYR